MYEIKRYHFAQISSTNDYAKELVKTDGLVAVTADYQWSGRGRSEKVWEGDQTKNVYCSLGIRHVSLLDMDGLLSWQALGCLVAKLALLHVAPTKQFALKYPNDVMVKSTTGHWVKICGVLVEHEFSGAQCIATVVGIGINIRQEHFPSYLHSRATSLLYEGVDVAVEDVVDSLLHYWALLSKDTARSILEKWKHELNIEGKIVEIVGDSAEWQATRLLDDGRLHTRHLSTGAERLIDNGDSIRYDIG